MLLFRHYARLGHGGIVLPAPLDVVLGEGTHRSVVQPDIVFVTAEHAAIVTEPEIVGPPDLAVEVLSPFNPDHDRGLEKTLYAQRRS